MEGSADNDQFVRLVLEHTFVFYQTLWHPNRQGHSTTTLSQQPPPQPPPQQQQVNRQQERQRHDHKIKGFLHQTTPS